MMRAVPDYRNIAALFLALFMLFLHARHSVAEEIPPELNEWKGWVLHGHEDLFCPSLPDGSMHLCRWSYPFFLDVDVKGGVFSQTWTFDAPGWIPLPGSMKIWPVTVTVNGESQIPVERNGRPSIRIKTKGVAKVIGRFRWSDMPDAIPLPEENAFVGRLTINGNDVKYPHISRGSLLLRGGEAEHSLTVPEKVDIQVFRKICDSIPMFIETRIMLQVSGSAREIVLGCQSRAHEIPFMLESALPIRLESHGALRVNVRPGRWNIKYITRMSSRVGRLKAVSVPEGIWPDYEYWSFEAEPSIRSVTISGLQSADPSLTNIPAEWRSLPVYLVRAGDEMIIKEARRGDEGPDPDTLELSRTLWLDHAGGMFTVQDRMKGRISKSQRIEASAGMEPGRVTINGIDRLITRLTSESPAGVEVRQGQTVVEAVSRLAGSGQIPVSGWLHNMKKVSAVLNLPPGWRLFYAKGVDKAASWISSWSLFDIFIILIICLATARIHGWGAALIMFAAITLTYHESNAPTVVWLVILATTALLRAAQGHRRLMRLVKTVRYVAAAVLVIQAIPFSIHQVRSAIYPQLELGGYMQMLSGPIGNDVMPQTERMLEKMAMSAPKGLAQGKAAVKKTVLRPSSFYRKPDLYQPDIQALIQTGPGLPSWTWRQVRLIWDGPVAVSRMMELYFISPFINLVLNSYNKCTAFTMWLL